MTKRLIGNRGPGGKRRVTVPKPLLSLPSVTIHTMNKD